MSKDVVGSSTTSSSTADDVGVKRLLPVLLFIVNGISMLAFRPTMMLSLPTIQTSLGFSIEDSGRVLSTAQFAYTISKPLSQVLSDQFDTAAPMMIFSMLTTAFASCLLSCATTLWQVEMLLVTVMLGQGPCGPAISKMIVNCYGPNERGFAFSVVYTAANLMACIVPAMVNWMILTGGWESLHLGVGLATGVVGVILTPFLLRLEGDTAERLDVAEQQDEEDDDEIDANLWTVLASRAVWVGGINMFFLYGLRLGFEGWLGSYLTQRFSASSRGTGTWLAGGGAESSTQLASGATQAALVWWNAGGVLFTALAGPLSDRAGGPAMVALALSLGLVASTLLLHHTVIDHGSIQYALPAMAFVSGGAVYGQRVLMVMSCRAMVPKRVGGKADALMSVLAELGGVMAGFPMIKLVTLMDNWGVYTATLSVLAALILVTNLLLTLMEVQTRVLRRAKVD